MINLNIIMTDEKYLSRFKFSDMTILSIYFENCLVYYKLYTYILMFL